jgi:hypothetical protein
MQAQAAAALPPLCCRRCAEVVADRFNSPALDVIFQCFAHLIGALQRIDKRPIKVSSWFGPLEHGRRWTPGLA